MALVPTRQLCPTKALLETSLCKFHGRRLPFFSQNSSFSKTLSLSHFKSGCFFFSTSSYRWLDDWNKTHKRDGPKPPRVAMNYRKNGEFSGESDGGGTTMERIVEKLRKFGYVDGADEREDRGRGLERKIEKGLVEEIFYEEEGILPNTRGGFSRESPLGVGSGGEVRFPWEKRLEEEEKGKWTARSKSRTSLAELTLPESELRRLRSLMFQIKNKTRIKGGVTDDVVNVIHEKWKTSEVVRLKIEGTPALNMKRMHEILERKTGGLVIWRSGTSVALYRGVSYDVPSLKLNKRIYEGNRISPNRSQQVSWPNMSQQVGNQDIQAPLDAGPSETRQVPEGKSETNLENNKDFVPLAEVKYEDEIDNLLDVLGPRYTDWAGFDPLPVDADMLPGVVPGYQPPFRVLPYGVRSSLGHIEATALRRVARKLPPHFALGRNRQLQGLAAAMIKLWEKSSIAKIALKRGVQLTTSERMAEDIKKLTGGMLLSRNKDFLVFYRGKNFLSPKVAEALLERERLAKSLQDDEEQARLRASAFVVPRVEEIELSRVTGTLGETLEADARWGKKLDDHHKEKVMKEAEIMRHANIVRKLERKLAFVDRRLRKAEQALSKVEAFLKPTKRQADPESITEEERFMFRKIGLRMKAFLLLGRRGVFDGTIENMHLHWKYRELVKIIMKAKSFEQVKKVALTLEAESGGILVSVDKISKGYAILVYRGKDYQRPSTIRPKNLLTKRKALAWSIELQRYEALVKHVSVLQTRVEQLRSEIEQMNRVKDKGDEELYNRLDSAYPSDDEDDGDDSEEEQIYEVKDEEDEELYDRMSCAYPTDNEEEDDDDGYEEENGSDYMFRHTTVNMMSLEDEKGSGNGSEYNLRHTTVNTASFDDESTGSMPKLQSETNPTYSAALAAEEDDDYNEKEDGNEHTLRHRAVNTSMADERISSIPDHELETNFPHYGAQETKIRPGTCHETTNQELK